MTSSTSNLTNRRGTGKSPTTVQVFSIDDLPDPSGGVITLAEAIAYQINGSVDVSPNTMRANIANTIYGIDPFNDVLITDSSGSFIVGVDDNAIVQDLTISCPNGEAFDFKNTAGNEKTSVFSTESVLLICDKIATFENMNVVGFFTGGTISANDGITLKGSQFGIYIHHLWNISELSGTNIAHDLGTTIFDAITVSLVEFESTATNIFISGLPGGGNLSSNPTATGRVINNSILGPSANLVGVDPGDDKWFFFMSGIILSSFFY